MAAVFGAVVVVAAVWHAVDRHPPVWDYANHLERAIRCAQDLGTGNLAELFGRSLFYPPLVPCLAGLVYTALRSDVVFGQVVMLAFLGLGMAAIYLLGRRLAGGVGGVVAATVFGTAPIVLAIGLRFQLDVPLAAMVAAFLAALLETDRFEHRGLTLLAGAVFGLGALTKPPFVLFVAPACLLVAAGARGRRAWLHATSGALLAALIALPWYGPRAFALAGQVQNRSFKYAEGEGFPPALSPASLAYYPLNFPLQFGLVAVVLGLLGLAVAVRRRCWYVLAGLAPGLVLLGLQNKQMRYALPLLPIVAVAAGLGFAALPRAGRRVAVLAVVAAAVGQVGAATFYGPTVARLPFLASWLPDAAPPSPVDWQHRTILDFIARDSGGGPVRVSIVANHPYFSPSNFRYYALRDGRAVRVARAWDVEPIGIDYMVLKTGDLGPPLTVEKARRAVERLGYDPALARAFPVVGTFALPDGSTASVRARRLAAGLTVSPETLVRRIVDGIRARLDDIVRDAEGLDVRVDYDAGLVNGRIKRLHIGATAATVGELRRREPALLRVRELRLTVDEVLFNPWSAERGRFDPLDAERLAVEHAIIDASDLDVFVGQLRGGGRMRLALGAGFIDLGVDVLGPDLTARVRLAAAPDRPFVLRAEQLAIGGVPVPSGFVDWVLRHVDPSGQMAHRLPFPATIGPVTVTAQSIRIGGS